MHEQNSGYAHGTSGSPQQSLEQEIYGMTVREIEASVEEEEEVYIVNELPKKAPVDIPLNASIKKEDKVGYVQVKYQWTSGEYKYTARWHTRTPNAPVDQTESWVIERRVPGIGYGPNARKAKVEILVRGKDGEKVWVPKKTWQRAINARRNQKSNKEQEELLNNGHWTSK